MIDTFDKNYQPNIEELKEYVEYPLFNQFIDSLIDIYHPICQIQYSGENQFAGWNIKYRKSGKSLCTIYPHRNSCRLLLVVGKKEKDRVESLLPTLSKSFQEVYSAALDFIGQRWLILELTDIVYDDVLKIIQVRMTKNI